jgi:hypothetical protein
MGFGMSEITSILTKEGFMQGIQLLSINYRQAPPGADTPYASRILQIWKNHFCRYYHSDEAFINAVDCYIAHSSFFPRSPEEFVKAVQSNQTVSEHKPFAALPPAQFTEEEIEENKRRLGELLFSRGFFRDKNQLLNEESRSNILSFENRKAAKIQEELLEKQLFEKRKQEALERLKSLGHEPTGGQSNTHEQEEMNKYLEQYGNNG